LSKITEEMAKRIIDSYRPPSDPNYKTRSERAEEFGVTRGIIADIDLKHSWKHLERTVEYVLENRGQRKRSVSSSIEVDDETVIAVIASKKHKYDPSYLNQRDRAVLHGIKFSTLRLIDTGIIKGHLPRPTIIPYPKPGRSLDGLKDAFEKVKLNCKYTDEVNVHMGTPCLEWQGKLWHCNRPRVTVNGISQCAYTFACEYHEGRFLPKGMHIRHLCNNPKCCEPTHLKMGTAKENAHDKLVHATQRGFKLNYEKVREIRERARTEHLSTVELGRIYGITTRHAWWILKNQAWPE
jgi:hypothetical protein